MMFRRWTLAAISLLFAVPPALPGKYPSTPADVVRMYCEFDLKTGRISTANFAKLPPLVTWEEEPGWDTVTIVSGFRILSSKLFDRRATVSVRWDVLGHSEAENVTKDRKSEVVEYQLKQINGLWKIDEPVIPPHILLSTARAFVLSQFQNEPKRQASWLHSLDTLTEVKRNGSRTRSD
jgi:hypothetical protein